MEIKNYHRYIIGGLIGGIVSIPIYSSLSYYNILILILLIIAIIIDLKNGNNI